MHVGFLYEIFVEKDTKEPEKIITLIYYDY